MQPSSRKPHVLIVGAGIGGLTLAQALRHQDVEVSVFERDESPSSRSQGWAITLQQDMIDLLHSTTPCDLHDLEQVDHLHGWNIPCEAAVFDICGRTVKEVRRFGPEHGQYMIRASRARLRAWLLFGLEGRVHWDKKFARFIETEDEVTVVFEDGTQFRGHVLVGVDGIDSKVRKQFFSQQHSPLQLQTRPLGTIMGECTATKAQYDVWMGTAKSYYTAVSESLRLAVALNTIATDGLSAEYYWLYSWRDEGATQDDFWTMDASQQELYDFLMARVDGLPEEIARVIRAMAAVGRYGSATIGL